MKSRGKTEASPASADEELRGLVGQDGCTLERIGLLMVWRDGSRTCWRCGLLSSFACVPKVRFDSTKSVPRIRTVTKT